MNIDPNNLPTTVDGAARQLLGGMTETERAEFRESAAHELHFGIGLEIRNAWRLHERDSPIHRDAMVREGYGDSGYDPLDGDSVSGLIIAKAQEMLRGEPTLECHERLHPPGTDPMKENPYLPTEFRDRMDDFIHRNRRFQKPSRGTLEPDHPGQCRVPEGKPQKPNC